MMVFNMSLFSKKHIKITLKLLLMLILVVFVQYLYSVSRKQMDDGLDQAEDYFKIIHSAYPLCPESFKINETEDKWFKKKFEQISPFTNQAEGNSNNEDLMFSNVVIMTPISNVQDKIKHYFKLLCSLEYPHDKISVVLGEDSSRDQTLYEAKKIARVLRPYFNRIEVFNLNVDHSYPPAKYKHVFESQYSRRKHIAMSRNQILSKGLQNETWVLWLDADIRHIPVDLIQHLMSAKKDIVTANCLYRSPRSSNVEIYDRNNWQETAESLWYLKNKPQDYLRVEGYNTIQRRFLNELKFEATVPHNDLDVKAQWRAAARNVEASSNNDDGPLKIKTNFSSNHKILVKLDGVGGCVLLVNADLHRRGLNFPPFLFKHHIETEGFAKMALQVYGVQAYGLPWIHVIHW